ncbi:7SK snRNA methylphosphate capping enzyme [Eudromia elegans]
MRTACHKRSPAAQVQREEGAPFRAHAQCGPGRRDYNSQEAEQAPPELEPPPSSARSRYRPSPLAAREAAGAAMLEMAAERQRFLAPATAAAEGRARNRRRGGLGAASRQAAAGSGGGGHGHQHGHQHGRRRRRRPVLPSQFLLGGNIFDPLNLNSLLDEEVNRALNARTPQSSPLPARGRDPVEILVPRDITDPLSLNDGDGGAAPPQQQQRGGDAKAAAAAGGEAAAAPPSCGPGEVTVTPRADGGDSGGGRHHRKRRRTCSKSEAAKQQQQQQQAEGVKQQQQADGVARQQADGVNQQQQQAEGVKQGQAAGANPQQQQAEGAHGRQAGGGGEQQAEGAKRPRQQAKGSPEKGGRGRGGRRRQQSRRFQYGNYSRYYGYRVGAAGAEDGRLRAMRAEWFRGKEVLDVGCNVGHVALAIARRWGPARVVGLDIDGALIRSARMNIRRCLSEDIEAAARAPPRRGVTRTTTTTDGEGGGGGTFPDNVVFVTGNYVLERDELVAAQRAAFDVVLLLSVTKWVQLNWGDEGLKRLFKRVFRHLRPGGLLLLEPQPWASYAKRKGLTETTYRNYQRIRLRPEHFPAYLTSAEVGFASCELVATPQHSARGFRRPIYLLRKDR